MIKIKGKEYPVSVFKFTCHDDIADKFEQVGKWLKCPTNLDTFYRMTDHIYTVLKQQDDFYKMKLNIEEKNK